MVLTLKSGPVVPTVRLLLSHPAHFLSLGLGSGLSPVAPGTVGSFLAWGLYCLLAPHFTDLSFAFFLTACFFGGGLFVDRTGRALGVVDHGAIVWDEFVAVWLVLWLVPATWLWQLLGVVVFRFFDIVKPWPIKQADARFKNGMGVMLDDLLAAGYSLLVLAIVWRVLS
ncbi:MAG: phosphatidylglycerophosphatase A [Rhodocyclaceae bacterium]